MRRQIVSLTAANILDFGLQFLLPIVLVRQLSIGDFSNYRVIWLVIGGVVALAPFYVPRSLLYFIPRSEPLDRVRIVQQSVIFLLLSGVLTSFAVAVWFHLFPGSLEKIGPNSWFLPIFLSIWIAAGLADVLPSAFGKVTEQAALILVLALLRVVAVAGAATSGNLSHVLFALVVYAGLKLGYVFYFIQHRAFGVKWQLSRALVWEQWHYVFPFGIASALFLFRGQADQWVAASMFSKTEFAAFSIGVIIHPLVSLVRNSVNSAITPRLSSLEANRDVPAMLRLNNQANLAVAYFIFPLLGLVWLLADHIVTIVYTATYIAAADVMRVYVIALLGVAVEVSTLTFVLAQGRFLVLVDAFMLLAAVVFGYFGALWLGLPGAALGGCFTLVAANAISFFRVSRLTNVPMAKLQHWSLILRISASASLAVLVVVGFRSVFPPLASMLMDAALISLVFGLAYLPFLALFGTVRPGVAVILGKSKR